MPDARVERTRAALTAAVLKLLETRDFSAVTIGEIVEAAGIGYATFFRHYKDKEELLLDAADRLTDALLPDILPALASDDTAEAALAICRHIERNASAFQALLTAAAEPTVQRLMIEQRIAWAHGVGLPDPPGLPPDLAITHTVHAAQALLTWWLQRGRDMPAEEMAAILDRLVLSPVRKG